MPSIDSAQKRSIRNSVNFLFNSVRLHIAKWMKGVHLQHTVIVITTFKTNATLKFVLCTQQANMCYAVSERGGRVDLNIEEVTCDQVQYMTRLSHRYTRKMSQDIFRYIGYWISALGYDQKIFIPVNYNVETSKLHLVVSNIQLGWGHTENWPIN